MRHVSVAVVVAVVLIRSGNKLWLAWRGIHGVFKLGFRMRNVAHHACFGIEVLVVSVENEGSA